MDVPGGGQAQIRVRGERLPYVSRGGLKLEAALDAFQVDPTNRICADLGASTGGFTDCLLQRDAASVIAIDTGYGVLAWKLRSDDRVTVMERTNALHAPAPPEPVDLVVIDLAWTPHGFVVEGVDEASHFAQRGAIRTACRIHPNHAGHLRFRRVVW